MENKRLYLEVGEKGRVTADVRVTVDPATIKWVCATGAVLMNEAEQNTPFDMRVLGILPGMAYVEFSCETPDGEKLEDRVEVHVLPKSSDSAKLVMQVRHFRKYHTGDAGVDLAAENESLAEGNSSQYLNAAERYFGEMTPAEIIENDLKKAELLRNTAFDNAPHGFDYNLGNNPDTEMKVVEGVQNGDEFSQITEDSIKKTENTGDGEAGAEDITSGSESSEGETAAANSEEIVSEADGETEIAPKESVTPDPAPKAAVKPKAAAKAPKAPKNTKEKKTETK